MNNKSYKILAFDFNTNILKDIYHKGFYTGAYHDFEKFLKENKFDRHPEGSFYISSTKMSRSEVKYIIEAASETFSWFKYCVKDIRTADIETPKFSDLTSLAQKGQNEKEYNELVEKTKEARRQKQQEAMKSYSFDNDRDTPSKSTDKER